MAKALKISEFKHDGHNLLRWHLERPDRRNAIGPCMAQNLNAALEDLQRRPQASLDALFITAETVDSPKGPLWVAGGDLKELANLKTLDEVYAYAKLMRQFCQSLESLPIPVVTFVDGLAIGGGAELALFGDIRIGTADCKFEWKQLAIGLCTGYGGTTRLIDLIGKAKTQQLLFFQESLAAREAHSLGLIHRVVSDFEDCLEHTTQLLRAGGAALAAQKRQIHLATATSAGDESWSEDLFCHIWRNPVHDRSLNRFINSKNQPGA